MSYYETPRQVLHALILAIRHDAKRARIRAMLADSARNQRLSNLVRADNRAACEILEYVNKMFDLCDYQPEPGEFP